MHDSEMILAFVHCLYNVALDHIKQTGSARYGPFL